MHEESIKVAVQVRPFNQREIDRHATPIIEMDDKSIFIIDPQPPHERKQFSFDYTYWPHNGCNQLASGSLQSNDNCSRYISQQKLFDDLGRDLLKNALDGFHCSLFAYGQTGSGKSFSMIGYDDNHGLIPMILNELFQHIENNKDSCTCYYVRLSMMEIYNEQVYDLLSNKLSKGLTVRQHPSSDYFYAQDLHAIPVDNYKSTENLLAEGIHNRAVASTNFNRTSCQAHTIVTIHLDQKIQTNYGENKRMSTMTFIDLAGSETIANLPASIDRFNERTTINRSLSTFGNVISALVDLSSEIKQKNVVPYRESILTKLLQNSLGGNSKTIILATLSPVDVNYNETLNTLIFADRIQQIKNNVSINEIPFEHDIHQLKEENQRFKSLIETGNYNLQLDIKRGMTSQEVEITRQQMKNNILLQVENNEKVLKDSKVPWNLKLKNAQTAEQHSSTLFKRFQFDYTFPMLANLHEDPMLSYVIYHYLNTDEITIGSRDCAIYLHGLNILQRHAIIRHIDANKYELSPAEPSARIKVNGHNLNGVAYLQHKDCILFGANHLYVFFNQTIERHESLLDISKTITWEYAQNDIAKVKGLLLGDNVAIEQEYLEQKVLNLLPLISEVNAITEELNKYRIFEIILMPISSWEGIPTHESKILIRIKNLVNHNVWLWDDNKFLSRFYIIQDYYRKFVEGQEDILYISKEDDPFWDPLEDILIGSANVYLQSLAYCMDFADQISIFDYKGFEQGCISVNLSPCSLNGDTLQKQNFVDQPEELLNKSYNFKITINHIEINDEQYSKGLRIRYKIFNELQFTETKIICRQTLRALINHTRVKNISSIDNKWLDFFDNGCIIFQIYAIQDDKKSTTDLFQLTTRELTIVEQSREDNARIPAYYLTMNSMNDSKLKLELILIHRKYTRLEQKQKRIQHLCREWENKYDYVGFHKCLSTVAFSSGTKLVPTNVKNENNLKDIYLFGTEEQEYLKDLTQDNPDRVKYWNDYYEKWASRQSHTPLSYCLSHKHLQVNSRINVSSYQRSSINIPSNHSNRLIRITTTKLNQADDLDNKSSTSTMNPSRLRWKQALKSSKCSRKEEHKKIVPNNETNSTTCIIQ